MTERAQPRPLAFALGAGYTVLLVVVMGLALSATEAARPGAESDLVSVTLCHALAHFGVLFLAIRIHEPDSSLREALGFRPVSVLTIALSAMLGAGLYPALARVDDLVTRRFPPDEKDLEILNTLTQAPTVPAKIVLFASLCLAMPLAEEAFFRGFLYGSLRRGRTAGMAAFATTTFFALARGDLRAMGSVCALGAALALVRARTGSTLASFVTHAAFYVVPLVPLLRGGTVLDDDAFTLRGVAIGLGVAVVGGVGLVTLAGRLSREKEALARDEG